MGSGILWEELISEVVRITQHRVAGGFNIPETDVEVKDEVREGAGLWNRIRVISFKTGSYHLELRFEVMEQVATTTPESRSDAQGFLGYLGISIPEGE